MCCVLSVDWNMVFLVCCAMFLVYFLLLFAWCVARCLLCVGCCLLLLCDGCGLLLLAFPGALFVVCCSLCIDRCVLLVAFCVLVVAGCLLFVVLC